MSSIRNDSSHNELLPLPKSNLFEKRWEKSVGLFHGCASNTCAESELWRLESLA